MSVTVTVALVCEGCGATFEPHLPPRTVGRVGDATIEARMAAQEAGWATRRNHSGHDLCTGCR